LTKISSLHWKYKSQEKRCRTKWNIIICYVIIYIIIIIYIKIIFIKFKLFIILLKINRKYDNIKHNKLVKYLLKNKEDYNEIMF